MSGPVSRPGRATGPAVLAAAAVAGLAWSSVHGLTALLLPVLVPLAVAGVVDQVLLGRPGARAVGPVVAGAAALVVVFLASGAGLPDVVDGVLAGWQHTLDSTLPAHGDARLAAFVPVLALAAGLLGVMWGRRGGGAGAQLAPGFVVLVLSQLVRPASGLAAVALAVAYGVAVAAVLVAGRRVARTPVSLIRHGAGLLPPFGALLVVGTALAGVSALVVVPDRPPRTAQELHTPRTTVSPAPDPLSTVADHLLAGDRPAFTADPEHPVDRWPLAVLDRFDGTTWTSSHQVRNLGSQLPSQPPAVASTTAAARISDVVLDGPWLPTQERLRSVDGIRPLVEPETGVLLRGRDTPGAYTIRWDDVQVDPAGLGASPLDPTLTGALEVGSLPSGITDLARGVVGPGVGATVRSALELERWMRKNYQVATGADLPTGHSTAQLLTFLTVSGRGTSEQFATAYALMARSLGIPTRVVVGFRDPGADGGGPVAVHQDDVLAWPEIAVAGVGWVPLDPTGGAATGSAGRSALSQATQVARDQLPAAGSPAPSAPHAPVPVPPAPAPASLWPVFVLGAVVVVVIVAVPAAKLLRRMRRRRPPPRSAVIGAWLEVRDALRDHGLAVPIGATPRSLAAPASDDLGVDPHDLHALAGCLDAVLWTGGEAHPDVVPHAWAARSRIVRALRRGPLRRRVHAMWTTTSLHRMREPGPSRAG